MARLSAVLLDDRLLIEELLVGVFHRRRRLDLYTTAYWYCRACRAAVAGGGGHLSGPFTDLAQPEQERAILSLLELRDDVGLPDPRRTVPEMAEVARRHPQLNLLDPRPSLRRASSRPRCGSPRRQRPGSFPGSSMRRA